MFSQWSFLAATVAVAFILNLILTALTLTMARKKQWLSPVNHRTIHPEPTPRLGGVGLAITFILVVGGLIFSAEWLRLPLPMIAHTHVVLLLGLGFVATNVVGLMDDFMEFRAVYKGTLQLAGGFLAIGSGVVVDHLTVPFTTWVIPLGPFGPFLTLLWILGLTNAVNLIDGMDGLAGSFAVMALGVIGVWGLATGHLFQALACAAGVGAVLAFLIFNLPPAKIFMGDSGSLTLGYLIAILSVWGGDTSLFHTFWLLPFTLVLIPVGDTVSAILRRLRTNRPIWAPDREHTHHKLLALGFHPWQVLGMVWGTMLLTTWPVLLASMSPQADTLVIAGCLVSGISVIVGFAVLHHVYRRRFPDAPPGATVQRLP